MLQAPIRDLSQRGEDGGEIGNALVDLKLKVEELDPAGFDFQPGWFTRTLGVLPFVGTPLKRYFSQYESAQTVIDAIDSLRPTAAELLRPEIDDRALDGLKFSECVPRDMAVACLEARLRDDDAAQRVLADPVQVSTKM